MPAGYNQESSSGTGIPDTYIALKEYTYQGIKSHDMCARPCNPMGSKSILRAFQRKSVYPFKAIYESGLRLSAWRDRIWMVEFLHSCRSGFAHVGAKASIRSMNKLTSQTPH